MPLFSDVGLLLPLHHTTETLEDLNARYAEAFLPVTVVFGVLTVFGVVGNVVILIVFIFSGDYPRTNFKMYVLTFSVIDLITCLTLIPAEMLKQRYFFTFHSSMICKVKCFLNVFGASSSCLALLVISVDRYVQVVQPLRKQLTPGVALKILFVVAFIIPVVFATPGTIMCGIKTTNLTNINDGKTEIKICEAEDEYRHSIWRNVYKLAFVALMTGISLIYVVLYMFVMREATRQLKALVALRKNSNYGIDTSSAVYDYECSAKQLPSTTTVYPEQSVFTNVDQSPSSDDVAGSKRGSTDSDQRDGRPFRIGLKKWLPIPKKPIFPTKTLVWFTLTIFFIITYFIYLTLNFLQFENMTPSKLALVSLLYRSYFLNHVINPFVYAIFVKRFRESFKRVFRCKKLN